MSFKIVKAVHVDNAARKKVFSILNAKIEFILCVEMF